MSIASGKADQSPGSNVRTKAWTTADAARISAGQEVQVSARRADGSPAAARTIWIVDTGGRLFVRSTNGRTAAWFRSAIASGLGVIHAGGRSFDVTFTEAADSDLAAVGAAYRRKYGRYASIVDHLEEPGPRSATLELHPV